MIAATMGLTRGRSVLDDTKEWLLVYDGFDPAAEGTREALCTLGNGYLATRGALAEHCASSTHYPGTYAAGLYNRLGSEIAGRWVENESLVNLPNWLCVTVRIGEGPWLGAGEDGGSGWHTPTARPTDPPGAATGGALGLVDHHVELDLARGVLSRTSVLTDPDGRRLRLTQRRIVSVRDPHVAAVETTVTPEGWSGRLSLRSAIDGTVRNSGVVRYQDLPDRHLANVAIDHTDDEVMCLRSETVQSRVVISQAARNRVFLDGERVAAGGDPSWGGDDTTGRWVGTDYTLEVADGQQVRLEKVVTTFTSRDGGIGEPDAEACRWVRHIVGDFEEILARHVVGWRHIWGRVGIDIGTDGEVGRYLNLHLFHVLQTVAPTTIFVDAGVPARGLHGEAYRGHIFWDELYVLPFLSLRVPQIARSALLYRYRRIDMARQLAADAGFAGAMFPWQSGSNGREETQTMHLNPVSGNWLPDASHLQRHVNAAIAFNVWQYYQATDDTEFMTFYGGELLLEIARFWASAATYNHAIDRFEILGVMGPDEYHEAYPWASEPGLDNNAYTNVMAVWCLVRAFELLDGLPPAAAVELRERIGLTQAELDHWGQVSRRMKVCFHDGVISQFERYEELRELDWDAYRQRYGDIHRLDRILEAEGDNTDNYKLTKQADVMMLFYLLSADELASLFTRLGYDWDDGLMQRTIDYYEPRTAHGSTLSRVVHAWIHARANREESWRLFREALHSDVDDIQGGTTAEGIHLGAMAGTIDLLQRCYTGLELTHDRLRLDPAVPDILAPLSFAVRYRSHLVQLRFEVDRTIVRMDPDEGAAITVAINGTEYDLEPGHTLEVERTPDS